MVRLVDITKKTSGVKPSLRVSIEKIFLESKASLQITLNFINSEITFFALADKEPCKY